MITTLSAMRVSLTKTLIIGFAVLLLTGCSALRLGYNNGPQLAWWWLDGYLDFTGEQAPPVKRAIGQWFDWHRATQVAPYADLLATAAQQITEPTTPAAACRWQALVTERLDPAIDRAVETAAEALPVLGEPQFSHLAQRYAKRNVELREEFLQPDRAVRLKASVDRTVERTESLYGSLDEAQRKVIAAGVAASPFDPEAWLAEQERRQRETLQTLRRLASERADADQRLAGLRALMERFERSTDLAYRAYRERLTAYNCAFAARIHNATTPAQRLQARDKLKGWEADLRSLLAPPRP
jgi:Family of unknown function (DUF6279)